MDKSLRIARPRRSRGVLTRGERITQLQQSDRWVEGRSPLGLPKVRVVKLAMKKKKKKKEEEGAEGARRACRGRQGWSRQAGSQSCPQEVVASR